MAAYLLPTAIVVCLGVTFALLGAMNREARSGGGPATAEDHAKAAPSAPCHGCSSRGICAPASGDSTPEPDESAAARPSDAAADELEELG